MFAVSDQVIIFDTFTHSLFVYSFWTISKWLMVLLRFNVMTRFNGERCCIIVLSESTVSMTNLLSYSVPQVLHHNEWCVCFWEWLVGFADETNIHSGLKKWAFNRARSSLFESDSISLHSFTLSHLSLPSHSCIVIEWNQVDFLSKKMTWWKFWKLFLMERYALSNDLSFHLPDDSVYCLMIQCWISTRLHEASWC